MGKYKFRFSDMIPNAWFYKLKDMNKRRNHHSETLKNPTNYKHSSSSSLSSSSLPLKDHISKKPHLSEERKSYYFTRDLSDKQFPPPEPPRKSSRRRRSTKRNRRPPPRIVPSSISAGCSCRASVESVWTKPGPDSCSEDLLSPSSSDHDSILTEFGSDRGRTPETFDGGFSCSSSCKCTTENDIVIDMVVGDERPFNQGQSHMQVTTSDYTLDHLPPIITKKNEPTTKIERTSTEFSETNKYGSLSVKVIKENIVATTRSPIRRFSVNSSSPGVKLRVNSPRIANRRIQGRKSTSSLSRQSISESFAVVKTSKDPRKDFTESMMEMIVENNIMASKDLEDLLACYLSLNSDEYHDLIINVFKQIWFDYIQLRVK